MLFFFSFITCLKKKKYRIYISKISKISKISDIFDIFENITIFSNPASNTRAVFSKNSFLLLLWNLNTCLHVKFEEVG